MENKIEIEPKIEKKLKLFVRIFFILIISFLIIYFYVNGDKITYKQLMNIERQTMVIDIFKNKEQHNFLYVKFSNGKREIMEFPYKIGDSLSKKKGDSIEYIFRGKGILRNNLFKNYKY